jgi:uncharacterized protein YaiE (UPF0345 family)
MCQTLGYHGQRSKIGAPVTEGTECTVRIVVELMYHFSKAILCRIEANIGALKYRLVVVHRW